MSTLHTLRLAVRFSLREKELERVYSQGVKSLRADAFVQVKDLGLGLPADSPPKVPEADPVAPDAPEGELPDELL